MAYNEPTNKGGIGAKSKNSSSTTKTKEPSDDNSVHDQSVFSIPIGHGGPKDIFTDL
jgi:hypothetical protein